MAKGLTRQKARKILHDKSVRGHALTEAQRGFFGARASGLPMRRRKFNKERARTQMLKRR